MFVCERFPLIAPKPIEFPAVVREEVTLADGIEEDEALHTYKPQARIWLIAKRHASKSSIKVLDKEENLCFAYSHILLKGCPILRCSGRRMRMELLSR